MAESCVTHCRNMQDWLADPEGFSQTEGGWKPNKEIVEKAKRICPGVEISLADTDPSKISVNADGTTTLPAGAVNFHCEFFAADHGPDMGS